MEGMDASRSCSRSKFGVLALALALSGWAIRLSLDDRLAAAPPDPILLFPPVITVADRIGWIEVVVFPPAITGGGGAPAAARERPADSAGHAPPSTYADVIPLGVLLEMKCGDGPWGPPPAEGVAADGLVLVLQRPVL